VLPAVTQAADTKRAPSATVASWVLSPISARTNTTTVVSSGPQRAGADVSGGSSGLSVQMPNAMNPTASAHASAAGGSRRATQTPALAASA
jgi:hypothetical protein